MCQHATSYGLGNRGNSALASEQLMEFWFLESLVQSTKGAEEGKIAASVDSRKGWESLESKTSKASQHEGESEPIVRKIYELEIKSNIEFECVREKKKEDNDSTIENEGLEMSLKLDEKLKEEIIRRVIENRLQLMSVVWNVVLQYRKEIIEKSTSEVIKIKDSNDHFEENAQHENRKKMRLDGIRCKRISFK